MFCCLDISAAVSTCREIKRAEDTLLLCGLDTQRNVNQPACGLIPARHYNTSEDDRYSGNVAPCCETRPLHSVVTVFVREAWSHLIFLIEPHTGRLTDGLSYRIHSGISPLQ